jgi:hypothetical protein
MRKPLFLLICVPACVAQPTRLGAIAGTLAGDDGTNIVGGYVSLHLLSVRPEGRPRQTLWTVVTGAGGSFRFDGLPGGRYRLCAQVSSGAWLNPCEWGPQPPVVSLPGPPPIASVTMVLRKGVAVPVRVEDPGNILAQNEGKAPGAHLLLGVGNEALWFRPASLLSRDASGRSHQVVVPFNSAVKLVVRSTFFRLSDGAGVPLPRGTVQMPVFVPPGHTPAPIVLRVIGGG